MQITGSGIISVSLVPSGDGVFRGNDQVVDDNKVFNDLVTISAVAAKYSTWQIFNPDASGVTLLLDYIHNSAGTAGAYYVAYYDTELTTDNGVWTSRSGVGDNGLCHIRESNEDTQLGTPLIQPVVEVSVGRQLHLPYPLARAPGEGLIVVASNVNQTITFYGSGREI